MHIEIMHLSTHPTSITDPSLGAHAVVNASNERALLGTGVSAALRAECGGDAFQEELRRRLDEDFAGILNAGDCLITSAGTSEAFKFVLHVPAVDYRGPDQETGGPTGPARVRSCVFAFLKAARALAKQQNLEGEFIVATPLLGAGAGGLGPSASADVMLEAIRDELGAATPEERGLIKELIFVIFDPKDAALVNEKAARLGLK